MLALDGTVQRADAAGAARVLRVDAPDHERSEELRSSLGTRAGLVHLDAAGDEWVLYWPHDLAPVVIHSPLRLPNTFRPPKRGADKESIVRLDARAGEVLLALTTPLANERLVKLGAEMCEGGPAVVDAALHATTHERGVCGIVVEVRP